MGSCDCSKKPENITKRKYSCSFNQIKKHAKKKRIFETRHVNNTDQIMTHALNLDQTKRLNRKKKNVNPREKGRSAPETKI